MLATVAIVAAAVASGLAQTTTYAGPTGPTVGEMWEFESPTSAILNSPVIDQSGNVNVALSFGGAYSMNPATGASVWSYRSQDGSALGAPVPINGITYIPTTKGVAAVDAMTGATLWYWQDGLTMEFTPTVTWDPTLPTLVYVSGRGNDTNGFVYGINVPTGTTAFTIAADAATDTVLAFQGILYVVTPGYLSSAMAVFVYGYDGFGGSFLWEKPLTSINAIFNVVLLQLDSYGHIMICFTTHIPGNVVTCNSLWPSGNGAIAWGQTVTMPRATVVTGPSNLYLASTTGIQVFSLPTGQPQWTSSVYLSQLQPVPVFVPTGEYIYVATGGFNTLSLACLDESTGDLLWSFRDTQNAGVFGQPVIDTKGIVYVESFSSTAGSVVYALKAVAGASTPNVVWMFVFDPAGTTYYDTQLVISSGYLFVGNNAELEAVGTVSSSSGAKGGVIAGAVIGSLVGVGSIAAAVWWFKFKRPGSFASTFSVGATSYKTVGSGSSAAVTAAFSSKGAYNSGAAYSNL